MDRSNDYNDTSEYNELFLAVHNGDLNLVHSLLKKYSATETIRGRTLLHVATARGHAEIAKLFITNRDGRENTPLHLAIRENQPELFNLLLKDSNLNARNLNGERPLHYAALYNRPEFAKTLLDNDASIGVKNNNGKTPLDVALAKENVQMAEILFKHGAVLSNNDLTYMRPLRDAVEEGNFEMVKLLMVNGCNTVDIPSEYGSSLKLAVSSGRLDILEYLVKNGVKSIATVQEDKLGLFRSLIFQGGLETLTFLVDIGIKAMNLDEVFNATFYSGRHDMWKYLVTRLSKISANTYFQETQLHLAIRMGQLETVKAIVSEPSDEHESDTFARKLAVYIAVESGSEEILEILLNARYPVDTLFEFISPLHLAATFEHPRLVKMLLKAGADINLQTDYGLTPLHFAAISAQPAVVKFLLKKGADPFKISKYDESPLKMAIKIFSPFCDPVPVSALAFERLVKTTKMLIRYSKSKAIESLFSPAVRIRVLSSINDSNSKSDGLLSDVGNSVFRPEIVECIFNYLKKKNVKCCSESVLNDDDDPSEYTPELLQLMMEYNDTKSCFNIEINVSDRNYKCQLLITGYSKNVKNILSVISKLFYTYDEDNDNDVEKKSKIDFLKLLVCRLVLLKTNCDLTEYKNECEFIDLNDLREKCLKEKVDMQKTKVNKNLNFTFYDVLTKSIDKVAMYASNNDFLKAIEFSDIKFPLYADFLKANVEMAERRRDFINGCVSLMFHLVKKYHEIRISRIEINQIFKYLSIVDLRRFSAACS